MPHHVPHTHGQGQDDESLARLLDLDAIVHQGYLDEMTTWLHGAVSPEAVRRILDVGAGTGSGTVALAQRFAAAEVTALDVSESMLERVRSRGNAAGLSTRMSTARGDVSADIGGLGVFDLVWAATSLHEVADPGRALRNLHAALRPGGRLVVVEMDQVPRVLPMHLAGFEERINALVDRSGPRAADHPDWTPYLQTAGFTLVEQRTFTTAESAPGSGPRRGVRDPEPAADGRRRPPVARRRRPEDAGRPPGRWPRGCPARHAERPRISNRLARPASCLSRMRSAAA
jgi:ubiquinone/menaquinone biosynthesis C-methylase UbiE